MSEAPKKIWIYGKQWQESPEFYPMTFESDKPMVSKESYIRADLVDELVEALKFAWPIIEHERYKWDGSYGKNFDQTKAARTRQAFDKARAALARVKEEG